MFKYVKEFVYRLRGEYTTEKLIKMGMKVGKNFGRLNGVILDPSHCWLIEIGDNVTLAPRVHILCHDASTKGHLGYTKIGRVTIGNNVFVGAESVVLPNVKIGDNVIVGANSTVTHDVPDNVVVAGSPAKVICSLEEYLTKNREKMRSVPVYEEDYTLRGGVHRGKEKADDIRLAEWDWLCGLKVGKMDELISVVVPAYNLEKYIERSLQSICEQTYSNLEIIVVNDGSTDNTGRILDKLAERDSRINVVHKQNAGVSAARNTGLDIAKGEYIGFVDGDDIIEPNMYEKLLKNALIHDADISHCGYQMVFPNRVDYYYNTGKIVIQNTYQGVYDLVKADKIEPGLCNKLYKKTVIGESRLDEAIKINEDLLFNYLLFKKSKKAVFEDVCPYHYMVRKNSASTSSVNWNKLEDPIKVIELMLQQESGEIYQLLEKRYLYLLEKVSVMKELSVNLEYKSYQREKKQQLSKKLKSNELQAQYSKKEMLQMRLAVFSPFLYHAIHNVYARMTGSKDRYKVE